MQRSIVRSGSSRLIQLGVVTSVLAGAAVGRMFAFDIVHDLYADTLTTYKAAQAATQKAKPRPEQRANNLDGSSRRRSTHLISVAGNRYEDAWRGTTEVGGVLLDTGTWQPTEVDLSFPAHVPWVIGRSYDARQVDSGSLFDSDGPMGRNWTATSMPELVFYDDADNSKDVMYLVVGADRYAEYQRKSSGSSEFKGKNGSSGLILYASGSPDTYKLLDQDGNTVWFFGFNTSKSGAYGQLWKIVDPAGNVAYVGNSSTASTAVTDGYDSVGNGRLKYAYDSANHRFTYTYNADSTPHVSQVKAEVPTSGSWPSPSTTAEVGRVDYMYFGNESFGDAGDLKTVKVTVPLTDSGINDVREEYFRYYEGSYDASTNPGYPHQVLLVLDFEGARAFDYAGDATFDEDFLTASTADLKPYSSAYFTYDTGHRVSSAFFNGQCGCSGTGNGLFSFRYETNGSYTDNSGYDTTWCRRTSITQPDGTWVTQYFDEAGQPLSRVTTDADPAGSPTLRWVERVVRGSDALVSEIGSPENLSSYTHSTGSITASTSAGLVRTFTRSGSSPSTGVVTLVKFSKGTSGTAYYERSLAWDTPSQEVTSGGGTVVSRMPNEDKRYSDATTDGSTGGRYSDFTNTMSSGTIAMTQRDVTHQAVASANLGSNSTTVSKEHFTLGRRTDYQKDESGHITYREYDTSGLVKKLIRDADTALNGVGQDFYGITPPSGFTSSGTGLREKTEYTYDDQGRSTVTTLFSGDANHERKTLRYYSVLKDRRLVTLDFPKYTSGSYKVYGPVGYTVTNQAGKVELRGTIALTSNESTTALTGFIDETDGDPITAVDVGTVAQMRTSIYNSSGTQVSEERAYFTVPGSGAGSDGTNYDPTKYAYDDSGRRIRTKEATGTISRTVFNGRGQVSERWIGTNDYGSSGGEMSGPSNMVKIEELAYDAGSSDKNGNLTKRTLFIQDNTTGKRETTYSLDYRGRVIAVVNPTAPHTVNAYDNLGRVTATAQYSSSSGLSETSVPTTTTNRVALTETMYDELGRVYKTVRHKIDPSDGSDDDSLETLSWCDAEGQVIKRDGEQLEKFFYDRLDRQTHHFTLAALDNTERDGPTSTYSDADDLSGDVVLEEQQTTYDTDGMVIMEATIARLYDDLANGNTGALDTNGDTDSLMYTAANVKGRIQISSMWYDAFGRLADRVEYGTYGGTDFDRDALSVPSRSDTALRTSYSYNTDGTLFETTDPKGIVNRNEYDALGRRLKTISNYVNGSPSANGDDDQTVLYAYTDGLQTSITADLAGTDQVTTYTFGTTKGASAGDSKIATGHLLKKVQYPDSASSSWDIVAFAYNAQSEELWKRDQARDVSNQSDYNIIETTYDDAGRQTARAVTQLRAACDNAVLRIETAYDSLGRTSTVTQYDAASSGTVVDQVKYVYDDWGNLSSFQQDRDSAVGTGTHYDVSYAYEKATSGRNALRRTSITLPNSAAYTYTYSTASNCLDGVSSRVTQIAASGPTPLVTYDYNGVNQVVRTYLEEVDTMWKLSGTSSGVFDDLDRFNRVTTSKWTKDLATDRDLYHVNLTYDRNSNIETVDDTVLSGFDVLYTNDSLNRLTRAREGTLTTGSITTQFRDEQWTLSQTGNWDRDKLNLNSDGDFTDAGELDDTRVHDDVNELSTRDTDSNASVNYTLAYDAAGNMTDDGQSYKFEWDGFGRLRRVKNQSSTLLAEYWYNGLGYRLSHRYDTDRDGDCDSNDKKFHYFYDERWRIVAMYRGADANPKQQFLYHCAGNGGYGGSSYIDLCLFRDRDDGSGESLQADSSLEERVYYCQNWRADVVALITTGGLGEWAKYSAYGVPFSLPVGDCDSDGDCDAADITQVQTWRAGPTYNVRGDIDLDGDVDATDESEISGGFQGIYGGRGVLTNILNRKGYAGYEGDATAAMDWHVRHRVLAGGMGRWRTADPLGLVDGLNHFAYCRDGALMRLDPYGACSREPCLGNEPAFDSRKGSGDCSGYCRVLQSLSVTSTGRLGIPDDATTSQIDKYRRCMARAQTLFNNQNPVDYDCLADRLEMIFHFQECPTHADSLACDCHGPPRRFHYIFHCHSQPDDPYYFVYHCQLGLTFHPLNYIVTELIMDVQGVVVTGTCLGE